jgi:hypothetical protein
LQIAKCKLQIERRSERRAQRGRSFLETAQKAAYASNWFVARESDRHPKTSESKSIRGAIAQRSAQNHRPLDSTSSAPGD